MAVLPPANPATTATLNAARDPFVVADLGHALDPAAEERADEALMHEVVADRKLAARGKLGHARRGAGAAGAAVDRLFAVEDRVARVGLRVARRAGPEDMADPADGFVLRHPQLRANVTDRSISGPVIALYNPNSLKPG